MAIIIPKRGGFGESIGEALGGGLQGLGRGISQGMDQRGIANALEKLGLPRELAGADPQILSSLMQGSQAARIQSEGDDAMRILEETLSGTGPQYEQIDQLFQEKPGSILEESQQLVSPEAPSVDEEELPFKGQQRRVTPEARLSKDIDSIRKRLKDDKSITPRQRGDLQSQLDEREKRLEKISSELRKETKEDLKSMRTKYKDAEQDLKDLSRLQDLEDEGLISPSYFQVLHDVGLDIPALMNPASEEYQKISQRFIRKAKEYYGGNVTNNEMEQFLKTIPSLLQSAEGRKRVTSQMKNLSRLEVETYKSARKVIRNNAGIPPHDLWDRVDDDIKSKRKSLSVQFKKDLARDVPDAENKASAMLKIAAGKSAKPLGGAALGGLIGSVVPGLGTAAGAGVGAGATMGVSALRNMLSGLGGR